MRNITATYCSAGQYLRDMWTASDEHLHESIGTNAVQSFCWTFLAGNVLLYAASVAGNSDGAIRVPAEVDSSPDVTAGYDVLEIPSDVRKEGMAFAKFEDHDRYYSQNTLPATQEQVTLWTGMIREAYRRRYSRHLAASTS